MADLVRALIEWVRAHPHGAGALIGMLTFCESLAVLGLMVPGAVLMIAAGALVASGAVGFWTVCLWAVGGAVLGDAVSYWIGRRYHGHIREVWPFRNRPDRLQGGEEFFRRHGGKSVFLGRYIGPLRSVVPVVAGMLGMPPVRFYLVSALSALSWAPAHLLVGMVFGVALAVAGEVAGRLALLIALLAAGGWLVASLVRHTYGWLTVRARSRVLALKRWARERSWLAWLLGDLVEPDRHPTRTLAVWLLLLTGGVWLFFLALGGVLTLAPLIRADRSVFDLLQGLREPIADRVMVTLSALGDAAVLVPVAGFVALWLIARRDWRDLGSGAAAGVLAGLSVAILELALHVSRPVGPGSGVDTHGLPGGHATMAMVTYGLVALLCEEQLARRWRPLPHVLSALLVAGIALSRLYLGVQWLSGVVAGVALGLVWLALLALARLRRPNPHLGGAFAPLVAATLVVAAVWHVGADQRRDLLRYAVRPATVASTLEDWWTRGWQRLPAYRIDLEGGLKQPLNLQWAGRLDQIRRALEQEGWRQPVRLDGRSALRWLQPAPALAELPLLPQLHDGRFESLQRIRRVPGGDRLVVLRLWSTDLRLGADGIPVWIGALGWLGAKHLPLLEIPVTVEGSDEALEVSRTALPPSCVGRRVPSGGPPAAARPAAGRRVVTCRSERRSTEGAP